MDGDALNSIPNTYHSDFPSRQHEEDISTVGDLKFSMDEDPLDEYEEISLIQYMHFSLDDETSAHLSASSTISTQLWDDETQGTLTSVEDNLSRISDRTLDIDDGGDEATHSSMVTPKSFLQLRGISIANYNMGCNFHIGAAICLMMQNDLFVLAIQEHTPWNRQLSEGEIKSIHRQCERWGYFVIVSKLQIVIYAKELGTSVRNTTVHEDGRMIQLKLEIAQGKYANFCAMYGYPHSPNNRRETNNITQDEGSIIQGMRKLQKVLRTAIIKAKNAGELIYIFGDLQDTPDRSRMFYYGTNSIIKHPLGIVQTCEDCGLQCTIYNHLASLTKPVISRHGSKGGRFIDGMYSEASQMYYINGITILQDTGILSDHDLVISKFELGLKKYDVSKAKEERIEYREIMNIPVDMLPNAEHPTLSDRVKEAIFKSTRHYTNYFTK
jgi:hypothetical protein